MCARALPVQIVDVEQNVVSSQIHLQLVLLAQSANYAIQIARSLSNLI